jgi:hypothetical protein
MSEVVLRVQLSPPYSQARYDNQGYAEKMKVMGTYQSLKLRGTNLSSRLSSWCADRAMASTNTKIGRRYDKTNLKHETFINKAMLEEEMVSAMGFEPMTP